MDVLLTRQELARTMGRAGQTAEALTYIAGVLKDQERVLGTAHPQTLSTRFELTLLVAQSGDTHEAVRQLQSVLSDQQRILGLHSRTLSTRHQLGRLLSQTGPLEKALEVLSQVADDQEQFHGLLHPRTMATRYDHALVTQLTNDQSRPPHYWRRWRKTAGRRWTATTL